MIAYPRDWSPGDERSRYKRGGYLDAERRTSLPNTKGRLNGKIVLAGPERPLKAADKAYVNRISDADLAKLASAEQPKGDGEAIPAAAMKGIVDHFNQLAKTVAFLKAEGAAVIIKNSDAGDGGTIFVDGAAVGVQPETSNRLTTSLPHRFPHRTKNRSAHVPQITMPARTITASSGDQVGCETGNVGRDRFAITTTRTRWAQHHRRDTGPDPAVKDEVVMLGAHLDRGFVNRSHRQRPGSSSGNGSRQDNPCRGLKPRRTIRVALWPAKRGFVRLDR